MARWQPLPDGLEAQLRELVLHTRRSKERADRPPRQVAARQGALAGGDALRLVELWETAAHGRHPARDTPPDVVSGDAGPPTNRVRAGGEHLVGFEDFTAPLISERRSRQRRAVLAGAVAIVVLGGGLASGYELLPVAHRDTGPGAAGALPGFPCHDKVQDGRHYAGYVQTSTDVVGEGANGPQVTEIQCLLERQRVDAGTVDGHFGRRTAAAVRAYQRAHRLPADGVVGRDTWQWLRT
ncbi:peptidoglycan-binding domain-containing protein [Streptantibioticus ferralitis]|uniref:Peptidoglycan-binding domain-containing protein n=1 Tax=Streptantibioticus ferralitis TaxID=236510 RepID=A0ABT5Z2B2_9ACTN|nr:peptidoglycan-binding domain-containing protein [Streptantibioticus ferralitis]MDF2257908.1 peptidoglycan-binding domain-containing protein [Streptantibioticus ferralitis]